MSSRVPFLGDPHHKIYVVVVRRQVFKTATLAGGLILTTSRHGAHVSSCVVQERKPRRSREGLLWQFRREDEFRNWTTPTTRGQRGQLFYSQKFWTVCLTSKVPPANKSARQRTLHRKSSRRHSRESDSLCARCSKQPQLGCCGPATVQSFEIWMAAAGNCSLGRLAVEFSDTPKRFGKSFFCKIVSQDGYHGVYF